MANNAEASPIVASNPARRGNLVAVWEQDLWSVAGGQGAVAAYSFDNGRSWARTTLPFSTCAPGGGPYGRVLVPYVSIGGDGTAYAIGLSFAGVGLFPRSVETVVSRDGGVTWQTLRVLASYPAGGVRMAVTADSLRPGWAYAVWQVRHTAADATMHVVGYFARTSDHGRSWSAPVAITGLGAEDAFNNHLLVDARTGRLYDTYTSCLDTCTIAYITSRNNGRTWSQQHVVADQHLAPVTQPGTGKVVITLTPALSAISASGEIVLAWEDSRFSGDRYNEIAVSRSADAGRHWTATSAATTTRTPRSAPTCGEPPRATASTSIAHATWPVRSTHSARPPASTAPSASAKGWLPPDGASWPCSSRRPARPRPARPATRPTSTATVSAHTHRVIEPDHIHIPASDRRVAPHRKSR